jgi:hypothetical protein
VHYGNIYFLFLPLYSALRVKRILPSTVFFVHLNRRRTAAGDVVAREMLFGNWISAATGSNFQLDYGRTAVHKSA